MRKTRSNAEQCDFNPRSPHGERRISVSGGAGAEIFQSTLPARGATVPKLSVVRLPTDFNPRSPHGERRARRAGETGQESFQSTLPARGATQALTSLLADVLQFQSTLPARGATKRHRDDAIRETISIHAPRTGSDLQHAGGRRAVGISIHAPRTGSDTALENGFVDEIAISIHAPRTGSDAISVRRAPLTLHFNPRSPHGERRICASTRWIA